MSKRSFLNNTQKRLVIIGAASSGKTTLAKELSKKLRLKLIPEQARIICNKLGYKNIYNIKNTKEFRLLVLNEQIKLEEKYKNFISDRGTIDCWVHWLRWNIETAKSYESEKYYKLAKNQALKYSNIIYIPRLIKLKSDGFRWNDEDYQNQIDRLFKETLLSWELMSRTIVARSIKLKDRIREVLDNL